MKRRKFEGASLYLFLIRSLFPRLGQFSVFWTSKLYSMFFIKPLSFSYSSLRRLETLLNVVVSFSWCFDHTSIRIDSNRSTRFGEICVHFTQLISVTLHDNLQILVHKTNFLYHLSQCWSHIRKQRESFSIESNLLVRIDHCDCRKLVANMKYSIDRRD